MLEQVDRVQTEVLVIGGGAAGLTAALAARRQGLQVLLVSKGSAGRSGNTPMAEGAIQASFRSDDDPGKHARDTLLSGRGLCDGSLVERLAERAPECVRALESFGVRLRRDEDACHAQRTRDKVKVETAISCRD